ncbi:MAG: glycoside hydrolase family 57 protein [Bryobacteraceae bacterium]
MPDIYLCFVWHMHQPFYKDLVTGEYQLPWTRLHALKDYYGMVKVLEDFPEVHQTFNLVPSMMVQIQEYAEGHAADPFLRLALAPAERLTDDEVAFILRYFFQAQEHRLIRRYPRYGELLDAWLAADRNPRRARAFFSAGTLRDLQVLSQLAWFDEEFLAEPEVAALVRKARNYTLEDQAFIGQKQLGILRRVLPVYRDFAARGQIEISTTPFYHPILPLLCDSNIAGVSHPYVPLPSGFRYPQDARHQLERSLEYMKAEFGKAPAGLWPSEGSVSDEVFALAADLGFQWTATDNGVLSRTLERGAGPEATYRPYVWRQKDRELRAIFRDHELSDLIGFVYQRMDPRAAAGHFLDRIRANCYSFHSGGHPVLVPIILDGENAWEHYEANGRIFLKELYRRISEDPQMHALTVSEALSRVEPQPLSHIFPGSWINANFDVWIGAEEDNKAWEMLLRARETYDRVQNSPRWASISEDLRKLAWEELLIAEGSDWCWWYGPEHDSDNRAEFDQLFRSHLANVYHALGLTPPEELGRPILKVTAAELHHVPTGTIRPVIDGEVSSYFEWMGAGSFHVDGRQGAMHGQRYLVRQLLYGADRKDLFLRLDFEHTVDDLRVNLNFGGHAFNIEVRGHTAALVEDGPLEVAYAKVLEIRVPLAAIEVQPGNNVRVQILLWRGSLPLDALPQQGWLSLSTADPSEW